MSDLEIELRRAEQELRAIRADLNVLNSIFPKQSEARTDALTFCSVRKTPVPNDSRGSKNSALALFKIDRLDSAENQFSNLVDRDQFVFS